jgi:hypothetical protein
MKMRVGVQFASVLNCMFFVHIIAAPPPAPMPLEPADEASVLVPFAIVWSAVNDPGGIIAYNWEVSSSSSFTPVLLRDSTDGQTTRDAISGLAVGAYFWRVQAVNSALEQGEWSQPRRFNVTGAGPESPGSPVLNPTQGYSTFHPWETIRFSWTEVPEAVTYRLEVSTDPRFPVANAPGVTTFWMDNIAQASDQFAIVNEGNYYARVFAVDADNPQDGIRSLPSNIIEFSVFYNNPIGPAPQILSPINGGTITLPVTLNWAHVPNPQPSGYQVQVSSSSSFSNNETPTATQLTEPSLTLLSLTSGTKFWRVRSTHGMASPTTAAVTAWSAVGSFAISDAPPTPVSITPLRVPLYSGDETMVAVQLTAGVPPDGASIALSSSNPSLAPVPSSIFMQGTHAWMQFRMVVGEVTTPTAVTLTATLNGGSASGEFTIFPPSLKTLIGPAKITGGINAGAMVTLNGRAPSGGAVISLSSDSPAANPPATVTVPAGSYSTPFAFPTSEVFENTAITITASWQGAIAQARITLTPQPAPVSVSILPSWVIGGSGSSDGVVKIQQPTEPFDRHIPLSSSHPEITFLSSYALVPAHSDRGFFTVQTKAVSVITDVTITASGSGVHKSATLTVNPSGTAPPPSPLSSFTVNPSSVVGGDTATGTVGLSTAAPAGGLTVSLGSRIPSAASVPPSVTVPEGATSASFIVTTFPVATTTAELNAQLGDAILFAAITVNSPSPPPTPGTPSLLSPANNSNPPQPVFLDWSDASDAATYEIQISDSDKFRSTLVAETTSPSHATIGGLPSVRLYWRVRGVNSAGVAGSWSSVRRFTPQSAQQEEAALSSLALNPGVVVGGSSSQGTVTLNGAAPSGGAIVALSTSNSSVSGVPSSVTVAAGATSASFTVTTSPVSAQTSVNITASYGGATRSATLTLDPEFGGQLPAPSLLAPATDARFSPGQTITFDWTDVNGAASYTIQIDDSSDFTTPLVVQQNVTASMFATSSLPTTRMWWRARANNSAGSPGAWSSSRRFEVK